MAEPTTMQRRGLAKLGLAMPDGSYYIRNGSVGASDLDNAINAVGRGEPQSSHNAIRVHIMRRAKALGLSDKIPADWQADGSLKHGDTLDQQTDEFLEHFGIDGMRWGHHLPGVEAVGGPGNGGRKGKRAPFIQRGDHPDDNPPARAAEHAMGALKALHARVSHATEAAKKQSAAVHEASKKHLAHVAMIHNKAKAAHETHKANMAKLAKHPHKAQAKRAANAAQKLHAAHMTHLSKVAHQAHAAHQAHVAKLQVKTKLSQLNAHDKAELAKLSPTQRSALKKLTPQQRATLNKMTPAQKAKLSHLTQAEKTALSHLSPKQKEALAKATAASAKSRHEAATARKAHAAPTKAKAKAPHQTAHKPHVTAPKVKTKLSQLTAHDKSVLAKLSPAQRSALKSLTPAQRSTLAKLTPAQKAKLSRLTQAQRTELARAATASVKKKPVSPVQNGSALKQGMDDSVGTFLEHFGVKGMKWGIRRNGGHPGAVRAKVPVTSSHDHQVAALIKAKAKANGGVHALSNDELRTAAERLNLEANYHRLNPQTGGLEKGRNFVKTVTSDAKTVLDAVDTGRRVIKLAQSAQPSSAPGHQSRRTRNAPLKVVDVRAA